MLLHKTERPSLGLMPIKSSPDIIRFSINTIVTGFIMKRGKKKFADRSFIQTLQASTTLETLQFAAPLLEFIFFNYYEPRKI